MRKLLPLVLVLFACNVFGESKEITELRKKAEAGDAIAQTNLGTAYGRGEGVPKDSKEALKWWRKAAGEGDTQAQANLSDMYRLGRGVSQNNIAAYVWANMAVRNGHKQSAKLRDDIAKKITSAQLKIAKDLSLVCVKTNYKGC